MYLLKRNCVDRSDMLRVIGTMHLHQHLHLIWFLNYFHSLQQRSTTVYYSSPDALEVLGKLKTGLRN